jgi:hypothetical protein
LITFTREEAAMRRAGSETDRAIAEVIEVNIAHTTREEGSLHQVFLLSAPDDPETVRLPQPIRNDTVTESGRVWAWTMGQRYVSLASLTRPGVNVTSDLAS